MLAPSGLSFFHQIDGATATPGFTLGDTLAIRRHSPRSLYTLTWSPVAMPRSLASSLLISSEGCRSSLMNVGRCENELFKKLWAGGLSNWIGYRSASSGADSGDSRGGI